MYLKISMNSCTWATVHLSKNEEQCQHVLWNVDLDRSRMMLLTVQSQTLRLQADVFVGIARTSGLDRTPLGEGADYLIRTFHFNCSQQSTSSSILCCVSVGKCQPRPKIRRSLGEAKSCFFRLDSRVLPALRHRRRAGRGSSGAFTHDTQWFNFSPKHKRSARARTYIQTSSKDRIIFMSMCHDIDLDTKDNSNISVANYQMVSDSAAEFPKGLVLPRTLLLRTVVRNAHLQTRWTMESAGRRNDDYFQSHRSSCISSKKCVEAWNSEQKEEVDNRR